ncbi:hypothetical protein VOLCADRAFT_107711 [Volvox carteri f. nagariensis]|uniref:DUF1995 domain-containing protein n=1 Tax=Volvox carteri f. nagariensis TaxID=3068 RepID=D8UFS5_VOLCA|nr:uncharacterized protein VOLCADRAFT_107711 [Volvox carteri f. nagariensis]EFJ41431.1 hypothetical protein VOLCADRAFT_107711 [Volvox carteri f. nagariensis]|eukprot:XP_002957537.1 hypothetical protein VOLCADRAFT_107711 [Volvox carteri f. nagariensis]
MMLQNLPKQTGSLRQRCAAPRRATRGLGSAPLAAQQQQSEARLQAPAPFPVSYDQAMRQLLPRFPAPLFQHSAQEAVKAALADGAPLVEVEFPSTTLSSVSGDGEGQNEMNASMGFLRQFLGAFRSRAASTRVFFPDNVELAVARSGQTEDPAAGRKSLDPKFGDAVFQLGYLTQQNAAWAVFGFYKSGFDPVKLVKDTDDMLVIAYPSFNPRGELDRVRGGYYPALFFPEIAKLLLRNPLDENDVRVLWTSDKMPSLKEVALEILPAVWK